MFYPRALEWQGSEHIRKFLFRMLTIVLIQISFCSLKYATLSIGVQEYAGCIPMQKGNYSIFKRGHPFTVPMPNFLDSCKPNRCLPFWFSCKLDACLLFVNLCANTTYVYHFYKWDVCLHFLLSWKLNPYLLFWL